MKRMSFSAQNARERARLLLDAGTYQELLGPFDRMESPYLPAQGIVPQSDDGLVVARGNIRGRKALVLSIEGDFQGGSIGEVNGAKMAGALELALRSARGKHPIVPVLLLDSGGIRLQEANLGLLAIRDIHAAIISLREFVPVIGVIAGRIGCFGGMAIAAALCSVLIGTEIGRVGLNGPEVIEQEAGLAEFDAKDRQSIWHTMGCRTRAELGQIDILVSDSVGAICTAIGEQCERLPLIRELKTSQIGLQQERMRDYPMTAPVGDSTDQLSRGLLWLRALTDSSERFGTIPSVRSCDMKLGTGTASVIAIVPNSRAKFPRARAGQVGLEEGWELARVVTEALRADAQGEKRAFILIVDSPGQAYGRHEETLGIHHSLAAAVEAYATARKMGHPVIAFLVGKAISGGFLAHGLQADFMLALDTHDVEVHVMSEESVARITRRTPVEISTLARSAPSTARDIRSFASLGAVDVLIRWSNSDEPSVQSVKAIRTVLIEAIACTRQRLRTPPSASHPIVEEPRQMALLVRQMLETQWF